ncbi:DsbA family oxidoreductase [Tropicimonas sp. IMCC34011]|uniref:DsbA family oxidoreductase n=1 Tax=Tropicimonas sp. IMCC34011 TaxID=2248759 RepID=UPI000E246D09|nr:DsbA family oxidoreductase [Tropicimonas sp. IMCC34011]
MITLDIISDPVCPWCYIGKAHLDRALADRPDHPFTIAWHPFQLDPEIPRGGLDRGEYLEGKFGSKEAVVQLHTRIDEAARDAGLQIDWETIKRSPNTIDAHRLIHWAGIERKQGAVVDALFAAYFQEGRDIGDRDVLADIADGAGLDAAAIRRLLDGDADTAEIETREAHSRERGVSAVPTFIIANQHVVPGAQQPDLWLKLIDEINAQLA